MVPNLFENPEEADDQVGAVEHDAPEDDANECQLVVANLIPDGSLARGYIWHTLYVVPPESGPRRNAAQGRREVVVEAEREGCGPHGYEEHLGGGVHEFCRR